MTASSFPTYLRPVFRAMQLDDLDLVMEIEKQSFPTPWPRSIYAREVTSDTIGRYYVVAPTEATGTAPSVLAYGGAWVLGSEAHVTTIATHPAWRRHGLAAWLLLQMLRRVRTDGIEQVSLEVREHNAPAISLYEKLGFVPVGRRRRYYRDNGEDALIYTLFELDKEETARRLNDILAQLTAP